VPHVHGGAEALNALPPLRDRPDDVRELRNAIERAFILCDGGLVTAEHLPLGLVPTAPPAAAKPATLDGVERELILRAMAEAANNKSKAARLLGLSRAQLRSRLEKHGISSGD
jgi:two-component system response regulator HydG